MTILSPTLRVTIAWSFIFLILTSSCTFYKARNKKVSDTPVIDMTQYAPPHFSFILHVGNDQYLLQDVTLNKSQNEIIGSLAGLDPKLNQLAERADIGTTRRYRSYERPYYRQVHIYTSQYTDLGRHRVSIFGEQIERVEIYNMDILLTALSYSASAAAGFVAALAIFIAIACSCPHVYTADGNAYNITSALFPGAVAANLQRRDYRILPDYHPDNTQYTLKVVNEEYEVQHTDLLQLKVAYHRPDLRVVPDRNGKLHALSKVNPPIRATTAEGTDLLYEVSHHDDLGYSFDRKTENTFSSVTVAFAIPENAEEGRLVLRAKNTGWGGYAYQSLISKFGHRYDDWVKRNQSKPAAEKKAWMREQGMMLRIDQEIAGQWQLVENVDVMGDVAYAEIVIPLQGKSIQNRNGQTMFRLTSGFKFWDVDYVGIDYESALVTDVRHITPKVAQDDLSNDVRDLVAQEDGVYMVHEKKGQWTNIIFDLPATPSDLERTLILEGSGYYTPAFTFEGMPRRLELARFRSPGALSRYSRQLYEDFANHINVTE